MHRIRKIAGWVLWLLGVGFSVAKTISDWIGRSTLPDDTSDLVRKMAPALEFLQRQPDLWFYAFQVTLIAIGLMLVFWGRISRAIWKEVDTVPASLPAAEKKPAPPAMKSIADLSASDFSECMKISKTTQVKGSNSDGMLHLCINDHSYSKFLVVYLPFTEHLVGAIQELASTAPKMVEDLQKGVQVFSKDHADTADIDLGSIPFVNRIVIYHEGRLSLQELAQLDTLYKEQGLTLTVRGSDYATARWMAARANQEQSGARQ